MTYKKRTYRRLNDSPRFTRSMESFDYIEDLQKGNIKTPKIYGLCRVCQQPLYTKGKKYCSIECTYIARKGVKRLDNKNRYIKRICSGYHDDIIGCKDTYTLIKRLEFHLTGNIFYHKACGKNRSHTRTIHTIWRLCERCNLPYRCVDITRLKDIDILPIHRLYSVYCSHECKEGYIIPESTRQDIFNEWITYHGHLNQRGTTKQSRAFRESILHMMDTHMDQQL